MKWVILGSGNVATQFGKALSAAGHTILQVYSRSKENSARLAKEVEAESTTEVEKINQEADFYFIAVSDNAIEDVVRILDENIQGTVVHSSGATSISVLQKFKKHGVMYPLQTLRKETKVDFSFLPISIEGGDPETETILLNIAEELTNEVSLYNSQQRLAMHVSAIFANNFTNHLLGIAYEILEGNEIPKETLRPLILETFQKALQHNPYEIQTGPAKRHDRNTQSKHLNFLKQKPEWQKIYKILSEEISTQGT